jgi:hypothetical protein
MQYRTSKIYFTKTAGTGITPDLPYTVLLVGSKYFQLPGWVTYSYR